MSTENAGAFSSTDTENSTDPIEISDETIERLCEIYEETETDALTDMLFDVVTDVVTVAQHQGERIDDLEEKAKLVDPLRKKLAITQDELASVKDEFQQYKERNEKDKAEIRGDVHETNEQTETNLTLFDTLNQKVKEFSGELKRVNDGRNSLEQIVRLPAEIAQEALSKNQLRARSIAQDISRLRSKEAFHGRKIITSSTIREKLQATYSKGHHQTVNRVMDFINEMGGEDVKIKRSETDNSKQLVFEENLVDLLTTAEELDADAIEQVNTSGVMATVRKG